MSLSPSSIPLLVAPGLRLLLGSCSPLSCSRPGRWESVPSGEPEAYSGPSQRPVAAAKPCDGILEDPATCRAFCWVHPQRRPYKGRPPLLLPAPGPGSAQQLALAGLPWPSAGRHSAPRLERRQEEEGAAAGGGRDSFLQGLFLLVLVSSSSLFIPFFVPGLYCWQCGGLPAQVMRTLKSAMPAHPEQPWRLRSSRVEAEACVSRSCHWSHSTGSPLSPPLFLVRGHSHYLLL